MMKFYFFLCFVAVCLAITTVHIIPHSHVDPGWKKTFDEYYQTSISGEYGILTRTIKCLYDNPGYKFHWEVIVFFEKWYNEYKDRDFNGKILWKDAVLLIVHRGQLEFVGGGMVEHDEALTTYSSIVDEITNGHLWLRKNLNYTVKTGWQVDTFGHSRVTPIMFKAMGYENLILNRIDPRFKGSEHLEFFWEGMFCHVLYRHYGDPRFDWEMTNWVNIPKKTIEFINYIKEMKHRYMGQEDIFYIWGNDFRFLDPDRNYRTMSELIASINKGTENHGLFVKYSTVSEYFGKLQKDRYSVKPIQDFLPYCDSYPLNYWSGYYSLRLHFKSLVRRSETLQRSVELLNALSDVENDEKIMKSRHFTDLFQHHDAITGTHLQHVNDDYVDKARKHHDLSTGLLQTSLCSILSKNRECDHNIFLRPHALNFQYQKQRIVVFHNSLAWRRKEIVRVSITTVDVDVKDENENLIPSQVISMEDGNYDLVFEGDFPALGDVTYILSLGSSRNASIAVSNQTIDQTQFQAQFRQNDNTMSYMVVNGTRRLFSQQFLWYDSVDFVRFANGTYIFRVNWGVLFLIGFVIGLGIGVFICVSFRKNNPKSSNRFIIIGISLFSGFAIVHAVFILRTDSFHAIATHHILFVGFPLGFFISLVMTPLFGLRGMSSFLLLLTIVVVGSFFGNQEYIARPIMTDDTHGLGFSGSIVSEYRQRFQKLDQTTIMYRDRSYFDVKYHNIIYDDDLITRFESNFDSDFATDSNGILQTPRIFNSLEFLPSNYFPATTRIDLGDNLHVYPSHSIGVMKIKNFFEVMLFRNERIDDERGLKAPVEDKQRSSTTLRFHFASTRIFVSSLEMQYPIIHFDLNPKISVRQWKRSFKTRYSPLREDMQSFFADKNIDFQIQYKRSHLILRFYNPNKNTIRIDPLKLFSDLKVTSMKKSSLNLQNFDSVKEIIIKDIFETYMCHINE